MSKSLLGPQPVPLSPYSFRVEGIRTQDQDKRKPKGKSRLNQGVINHQNGRRVGDVDDQKLHRSTSSTSSVGSQVLGRVNVCPNRRSSRGSLSPLDLTSGLVCPNCTQGGVRGGWTEKTKELDPRILWFPETPVLSLSGT